jgi:EpsI family protein
MDGAGRDIGATRPMRVFSKTDHAAVESKLRYKSTSLLVWRWYWVDGQYVANPYWGKILQAKSRLLGQRDDGAIVVVY